MAANPGAAAGCLILLVIFLFCMFGAYQAYKSLRKPKKKAPPPPPPRPVQPSYVPPPPPPPIQPAPQPPAPIVQTGKFKIDVGRNHLFLTEDVDETFRTFKKIMETGHPGLCLTNRFPDNVRQDYGIKADIQWFSETAQGDHVLNPRRLDFEVTKTTVNFIRGNEEPVILIDGLDYLILVNGFEAVSTFLKKITDIASMEHATLVVIVRPEALSQERVSYLKGQFDRVV